jgi:uncharacterized phage-associated protein
MSFDGREIANCVLDLADQEGIKLSNLSLQKVVFFCHAWHLVDTGQPLLKAEFEAWQHGPVLQYLYRQFKDFENRPITARATAMNSATGKSEVVRYDLDLDTLQRLKRVLKFYGRLEPWDLVDLSHAKGGPWDRVWNHSGRINPGMKIPNNSIQEFYSKVGEMGQIH